ncbi:hypothetical protein Vafri_17111 [Volvox africanus]|uniref:Uncharacterized protein n=1 Tax=Volvox africanus TaxID=51714 RepID=A0A8J4BIL5_9CHLO|nr:hypothetical protein Vafri_17111 [Volvox africanus]
MPDLPSRSASPLQLGPVSRLFFLLFLVLLLRLPQRPLAWRRPLQDADLVIVRGTCTSRLDLAHATGRAARRINSTDLRILYVLEDADKAQQLQDRFGSSLNETYLVWPDRPDPKKPGDTRVAMAPWLAHDALGESYKWILFGDDDTFFFVDGVKALLREYDHNLPYIVTDAIWHKRRRNLMEAPRCLPCHVTPAFRQAASIRSDTDKPTKTAATASGADSGSDGDSDGDSSSWIMPPQGCPCTPHLACEFTLNVTGIGRRSRPMVWSPESKLWGFPPDYPTKCDYPHFHGGSGVLISVGAMRQVPYSEAMRCYYDNVDKRTAKLESLKGSAHGDRMTSLCFWLHGVALTDPGLSLALGETTYIGNRVMDARTANPKALEEAASGTLPSNNWVWSILTMAAAHLGHHPGASELAWQLGKLYPEARRAAVRSLRLQGLWGRGDLDAQLVQQGLSWVKGRWVFDNTRATKAEDQDREGVSPGSGDWTSAESEAGAQRRGENGAGDMGGITTAY